MDVSVELIQACLEDAAECIGITTQGPGQSTIQQGKQANALRGQLRKSEKYLLENFVGIGSIAAVSKNSAHQTYRGPGIGSYTQEQQQTIFRILIKLYDWKKQKTDWLQKNQVAWFIEKYPEYVQDSDQAVYDECYCWLEKDFTQTTDDISELRLAPTLLPTNIALQEM